MYQRLLADASLFALQLEYDRDLARQAREAGCQSCGDVLHKADYLPHPKGGPLPSRHLWRNIYKGLRVLVVRLRMTNGATSQSSETSTSHAADPEGSA